MERWMIAGFMLVMFLGLAALGWRYRRAGLHPTPPICASAQAQCADRPYLGSP
jgi:hypothetical protein